MSEVPEVASAEAPRLLREEPEWLVVDKPAGWHSVAGGGDSGGPSVEAWLRATRPELAALEECGLVHRLDRFTSGCLLVAKDAGSRERLRAAFSGRGGDLRKTYLALVAGRAEPGSFTLSFASRHKGSAKVTVAPHGEPATIGRCRWKVAGRRGNETLLEVELLGPGRRHQIRAGLASLGFPLVGDTLYRGPEHARGVHLHAWRIEVEGVLTESPRPGWAGG
jgi:23S rRNA pseudouridine1911/1915/1917 synthase